MMSVSQDTTKQKLIFNYLQQHYDYFKFINFDYFNDKNLQELFKQSKFFYTQYKETPSKEQMKLLVKSAEIDINENVIDDIYNVQLVSYDNDWLKNEVESWIQWTNLTKNIVKAIEYMKSADVDMNNVQTIVNKTLDLVNESSRIDFNKNIGIDFWDVSNHNSENIIKMPCSFEFINNALGGGIAYKTLSCYLGAPNVGKSIFLCNDAANFVRMGKNTLYISCEMSESSVSRRVAANLLNVTLQEYDRLIEDKQALRKKIESLRKTSIIQPGNFFIRQYPTGSCTVFDVENYIKEIEETMKIKIDVVILDYIGIMCNYRNPNSENTYIMIKQLSQDLRGIAIRKDVSIITAMQVTRDAINGTNMTMKDISESMALAHTCDNIFAIIQDEIMLNENKYKLKIIKIRDGNCKNEVADIGVNYSKMKLTEDINTTDLDSHLKIDKYIDSNSNSINGIYF